MEKAICSVTKVMTGGFENISTHLAWLFAWAIKDTEAEDGIISIVCNPDLPDKMWGVYRPDVRAIGINLDWHFQQVLNKVQKADFMTTSVRVLLLRELLDTIFHEAWHAKICLETQDFTQTDLDEEGAKKHAMKSSWGMAELYDMELESFGPLLDKELHNFYKDLQEDVLEEDCKEWKKLQLHMMDNELCYYNPESGTEIRDFRTTMECYAQPKNAWCDADNTLFNKFREYTNKPFEDEVVKEAPVKQAPEAPVKQEPEVAPEQAPEVAVKQEPAQSPAQQPAAAADYDSSLDCNHQVENPFDDDDRVSEVAYAAPEEASVSAQPPHQSPQAPEAPINTQQNNQAPANNTNVRDIERIAEQVLRRMFNHVFTKCGFNTDGGFNNPKAVLDPVTVSDIVGVEQLLVCQDTYDAMGKYVARTKVENSVKGLVSADGRPYYRFYMNIGGALHKRIFTPANPKAVRDGKPTDWAVKSSQGFRIMGLQPERGGITADITLEPHQVLGQEELSFWNKKKR